MVGQQMVHQFIYGLTAASPWDGRLTSLILPWVNAKAMSLFLTHTATQFRSQHCLMLLDGVGWHTALALRVPPTIHLLSPPPFSPELNPVEPVWEYLRENYIGNRVFAALDDDTQQLCGGFHHLHRQPILVQSMTYFDWIKTLRLMFN
jgi:hypothetical protein